MGNKKGEMMKKIIFLVLGLICVVLLYGQSWIDDEIRPRTTVTNNNTITINGNVYYFRPSTTPSSPPPTQSSDFLGSGHWYGEDAARAWASIADWVFDYCLIASPAVTGGGNERIYISAVHVVRREDRDFENFATHSYWIGSTDVNFSRSNKQVRIDYWVVPNGAQMADGRRATRWFGF
jgi:hypothetical protein